MYQIYCDGASRSNPGEASVGISISKNNEEIDTIKKRIGIATNNVAEYSGLIEALQYCIEKNIMEVVIYLDSLLVVQQVNLEYKVKSKKLQEYYNQAIDLKNQINNIEINHVRREFNKRADQLANQALDEL
jgi:ribonuclease HI